MPFELKNIVPWGRNLNEYKNMFNLSDPDLGSKIISFGDGPASFNYEMKKMGKKVVSLDPIYQFSKNQIKERINQTRDEVIKQARENRDNFVWKNIKNIDDLEETRMQAMNLFLQDLEKGKKEKRYISHELPQKTGFPDLQFDLGLSSHFLILYSGLGTDFHIRSITEMLRCCREIRIFPVLNLNAEKSEVLDKIIDYFSKTYHVQLIKVNYEFQKNGNIMLAIKRI